MSQLWKLSPSDLTFLWDECPRCFYLKVVRGFNRPSAPFPRVFSRIDRLMKAFFDGKSSAEISPTLPPGVIRVDEHWVVSNPIPLPGHSAACYIKGRFDALVEFDDGGAGLVDFKTSESRPEHVAFYSRQLHAYMHALENPAPRSLGLAPVTRLGLLVVEPLEMTFTPGGQVAYLGGVTWMEIPRDDSAFLAFIDRVLSVLEAAEPPPAGASCAFCQYRQAARESGY
jgi:hypothetical protein